MQNSIFMEFSTVLSKHAPEPIGPYSQATLVGNLIFVSGQIGINPQTGLLIADSLESEVKMALQNLAQVLHAAGSDFSHIVKASLFIKDMNQFAQINTWYEACFETNKFPARETVEVSRLPKDAQFEVSVIAIQK